MDTASPYCMYELEQLHMQMLLNCHLTAFRIDCIKKQPNDNLITLVCVIALVYDTAWETVSSWPQFNVRSCSYQLF